MLFYAEIQGEGAQNDLQHAPGTNAATPHPTPTPHPPPTPRKSAWYIIDTVANSNI